MILPFSTQLNGKPTYFVEKIHKSLREIYFGRPALLAFAPELFHLSFYHECRQKCHTIREDKKNRWKPGVMIDFFINARQKNMFRFAPRIPVVSTQKVQIRYWSEDCARVLIDNKDFYAGYVNGVAIDKTYEDNILKLANNDGFDTVEDFFAYFNKDYTGKIIHWTDLKY